MKGNGGGVDRVRGANFLPVPLLAGPIFSLQDLSVTLFPRIPPLPSYLHLLLPPTAASPLPSLYHPSYYSYSSSPSNSPSPRVTGTLWRKKGSQIIVSSPPLHPKNATQQKEIHDDFFLLTPTAFTHPILVIQYVNHFVKKLFGERHEVTARPQGCQPIVSRRQLIRKVQVKASGWQS